MMEFSADAISAYRYWIQGYANFYEPIVHAWFPTAGYRVVAVPAHVTAEDLKRTANDLFDGYKKLGPELKDRTRAIREHLERCKYLKPDVLLEREGKWYLAELKSWGGSGSGLLDLVTVRRNFITSTDKGTFLLVDHIDGRTVAGKILVASARSPDHDAVLALLRGAYNTNVELYYLDEIIPTPQIAGAIARQLRYLDAAVAELKGALRSG